MFGLRRKFFSLVVLTPHGSVRCKFTLSLAEGYTTPTGRAMRLSGATKAHKGRLHLAAAFGVVSATYDTAGRST